MAVRDVIDSIKNDKSAKIFIVSMIILVIFAGLLIWQGSSTGKNNIVIKTDTVDKTYQSTSYTSEVTIPDNFTIEESSLKTDIQISSMDIKNSTGTLEILVDVVPTNTDKIVNTGNLGYLEPDDMLKNDLVYLTTIDNVKLYRDDYDLKYYNASVESGRNESMKFITSDRKILFPIYAETGDNLHPYISRFKTTKNERVEIIVKVSFDISDADYKKIGIQIDDFVKKLKI
ncbi:MAG: hypothetical protein WCJ19_05915 [bacterium]